MHLKVILSVLILGGLLLNNQRAFTRLKHGESELVLFEGGFQIGVVVELDFWFLIHFASGKMHTFIVATNLEFYFLGFSVAFTKGGGVLFETVFYLMIRHYLENLQNLDLPPTQ